jgi:hypothetical protein
MRRLTWILLLLGLAGPAAAQLPSAPYDLVVAMPSVGEAPQVTNLATAPTSVARYAKAEWIFDLTKTYANPYYYYDATDTAAANPANQTWFGVNGITVDLLVTAPSLVTKTVPCFWMEGYTRLNVSGEVLGKVDDGKWHCRYAPSEVGTYSYQFRTQDASGTWTGGTDTFQSTVSASRGFVRVSSVDSRYFAFDDGSTFRPIGVTRHQWGDDDGYLRSYTFDTAFAEFAANGINMTRVWDNYFLATEGIGPPVWVRQGWMYGGFFGIAVNDANRRTGLRAAAVVVNVGAFQRVALAAGEQTKTWRLSAYLKSAASGTGCRVSVTADSTQFGGGSTPLGATAYATGTSAYALYTTTFVPSDTSVALNLECAAGTTGTVYMDDLVFGPDNDVDGSVDYNALSDPGFEYQFNDDWPSNDPDADPTLVRPIGTWFHQWGSYQMDKVIEAAEANGVYIQLCDNKGPWFTWPENEQYITDGTFDDHWHVMARKRAFRYKAARWGYSTSILGWELENEQGHISPSGTPGAWAFFTSYSAYQLTTDPYQHLRTTSQNMQAYSPGFYSSSFADYVNIHWYLGDTVPPYPIASLASDETKSFSQMAWCVAAYDNPATAAACTGLDLGDGTDWSGPPKPVIWGEGGAIGHDSTDGDPNQELVNATNCLAGGFAATCWERAAANSTWVGMFSPVATVPLDWWFFLEDAAGKAAKYAARNALSRVMDGFDLAVCAPTHLLTPDEAPPGYAGPSITTSNSTAKAYGFRCSDQRETRVWVQHQDYIWSNPSTPSAISATLTIPGMLASTAYEVVIYSTTTGAELGRTSAISTAGGALDLATGTFSTSVAIVATTEEWSQLGGNPQRTGYVATDVVTTSTSWRWVWNGPLDGGDGTTAAGHLRLPKAVQPVTGDGRLYVGHSDGYVRAITASTGALAWTSAYLGSGGIINTAAYDRVRNRVYVGTQTGYLYELNAATGATTGSVALDGPVFAAPLLVGDTVYVTTRIGADPSSVGTGTLYAISTYTLATKWTYAAGAGLKGSPSYSRNYGGLVILLAEDESIHAVQATTGTQRWRVVYATAVDADPTTSRYNRGFVDMFPAVSDVADVVLVRGYQLWDDMWITGGAPSTSAETQTLVTNTPSLEAMLMLELNTGARRVRAPVLMGGIGNGGDMESGPPQAVIKRLPDNTDVAYVIWRTREACEVPAVCDGRDDSMFGEMSLTTGLIRYVQSYKGQGSFRCPTDEQSGISMAGDSLIHAHWMVFGGVRVTNRTAGVGDTFANPITTTELIPISNTLSSTGGYCPARSGHYCSDASTPPCDGQSIDPGFYVYYASTCQYDSNWTTAVRSAVAANRRIYWKSVDGAITAVGP